VAEPLRRAGVGVRNLAGETTLGEFIDLAAACRVFLTNDSGAMHVASALEVPTVAVFGATDDTTTGPTGPLARVVREHAECSPCLLRECPIDHRCMTRVSAARVTAEAALLLESQTWTREAKS
jgi:heptosyltransferase-2